VKVYVLPRSVCQQVHPGSALHWLPVVAADAAAAGAVAGTVVAAADAGAAAVEVVSAAAAGDELDEMILEEGKILTQRLPSSTATSGRTWMGCFFRCIGSKFARTLQRLEGHLQGLDSV
jgi:tetrahydromethanopterin S-methyltransferase subunit D